MYYSLPTSGEPGDHQQKVDNENSCGKCEKRSLEKMGIFKKGQTVN